MSGVRWAGSVAERIADAKSVTGQAVRFAREGRSDEVATRLSVVERLVDEDGSGDVARAVCGGMQELELVAGQRASDRPDLSLRARYLVVLR
jgi:hypothetical protein